MATKGDSKDTAHVVCITGDGAGLTIAKSGVRIGLFLGSTEYLNQSSNDVLDVVTYTVQKPRSNPSRAAVVLHVQCTMHLCVPSKYRNILHLL